MLDLTRPFASENDYPWQLETREVPLKSQNTAYTGVIHELRCSSMCGTYIDFPGHILESADGVDAASCPAERFWRLPAAVARLDRTGCPGGVTAEELSAAFGASAVPVAEASCLVVNALGPTDVWNRPDVRGVWLEMDAVEWIVASGCRLLVSDIYESNRLDGVFKRLFSAGVSTVCYPMGLHRLPVAPIAVSVLFPRVPGMVQIPCRLIAEEL